MTWVDDANAALFADLYELTMAASYHAHDLDQPHNIRGTEKVQADYHLRPGDRRRDPVNIER